MADSPAKSLVEQAVANFETGDLDQAIDLARQAIDADHRYADGYSILGVSLAQAGREDEALTALQKAVQSSPYNPSHYYNLALHHYFKGNKNDAIAMAQEAIRTDGKHRRANALLKTLEKETHVEVAPYTTSIGDSRGGAYKYKAENELEQTNNDLPPVAPPEG
jgi:Flp pilus assembly protein TadD